MVAANPTRARSSAAATTLLALVWSIPLGVLVQAALAGQAWFVSPSLFGLHGGVGHGVLTLAVVAAGLSWVVRVSTVGSVLLSVTVLALIGQTGLGYAGHRTGASLASSLHVPLGVIIVGLTVAAAVLVTVRLRGAR